MKREDIIEIGYFMLWVIVSKFTTNKSSYHIGNSIIEKIESLGYKIEKPRTNK